MCEVTIAKKGNTEREIDGCDSYEFSCSCNLLIFCVPSER